MKVEERRITKQMIANAIQDDKITFVVDPETDSGTVCKIGEYWFYFGGMEAEEQSPTEYLCNTGLFDVIEEIYDTLVVFESEPELVDEWNYYYSVLASK